MEIPVGDEMLPGRVVNRWDKQLMVMEKSLQHILAQLKRVASGVMTRKSVDQPNLQTWELLRLIQLFQSVGVNVI